MSKVSAVSSAFTQPLMSGSLWAIHLAEDVSNIQDIFDKVTNKFINDLRLKIKSDLENDEDWAPYADYLDIRIIDNELTITVDHPEAKALEYGTPDRPMKSKLRQYAYEASIDLAEAIEKAVKEAFG